MSGNILGEAATIYEGKNATLTSSYGTETRGTFTKSDVIISAEEIHFPEVMKEDIILALAPVAYNRYVSTMDKEALLIYDSSLITDIKESGIKQHGYPITDIARRLGNAAAANIVALGIIVKRTGAVSESSVLQAIENGFSNKPQVIELNKRAFMEGFHLA